MIPAEPVAPSTSGAAAVTRPADPAAIMVFSEIAAIDQIARTIIARALPRGMELSHFMVLNHLANAGGERSPAELARIFHVTRGAMSNTLARLEAAGHVHVRRDWEDARRKMVSISRAGRLARDAALASIEPVVARATAGIDPEALRRTLPVLRELRLRLEAEAGEGREGGAQPGRRAEAT
ncbi:MAG: MarR family transcriptional regulator [Alphaproteobacteria bacterium]|nr:MAG: MarR family transcriptional regulator [Alphaproteobacteria bacterium]